MDISLESKIGQMTHSAQDVFDELEKASGDGATVEDIEGAKALTADWLGQYDHSIQGLKSDEKQKFETELKNVAEKLKAKLVLLKEAPE
ncbi:MAG TPA: hypothetical protein VGB26_04045 [Nitrospiria bacterium]